MQLVKFAAYIIYTTAIFFIPNGIGLLIPVTVNLLCFGVNRIPLGKFLRQLMRFLPFVILTLIFNLWLDEMINALWIAVKLILVCSITIIYAHAVTVAQVAELMQQLLAPLELFHFDTEQIRIMVAVALSIIPLLGRDVRELKNAARAKNMPLNLRTIRQILVNLSLRIFIRANQIEESLVAKGYEE